MPDSDPAGYASREATGTDLPVHIVDDDAAVRRSLALLLESFGYEAYTYASAEALLDKLSGLRTGCLIVDIRMPGMDGPALQQELLARSCRMPVIVVTGHGDVGLAVRAMKSGAIDFIEKPYSQEAILRSVADAMIRVQDTRAQLLATQVAEQRLAMLTPREHDVLARLVEGQPNKVIGHALGISPRTVEIHRANLMEKLGCRSLAETVRLVIMAGRG